MAENTQSILILGSNSDLAQSVAYEFAKRKFNIILATRNVNEYQVRLAADLQTRHQVKVQNMVFDGWKTDDHQAFYDAITPSPDVVFSAFGYLGDQVRAQTDFKETLDVLYSNLVGQISILNIAANRMEDNRKGSIIGVSSVAGVRGRRSNYIYGCAKAGFTQYLSGLRSRLYPSGVHVISVIPGYMHTKMTKGINTPSFLTAHPDLVAARIWKAFRKKKNVIYVYGIWRLIMFLVYLIPEKLFKKINF